MKIRAETAVRMGKEPETIDLSKAYWHALFFVIGGAILLVVGLTATLLLGVSAADDRIFAVEALISGLLTEFFFFRRLLSKRLALLLKPQILFVYVWPLLCLYVFVTRPFE